MFRKIGITLFALLVKTAFLFGASPRQISRKQFAVANVSIGASEKAVLATFGPPIKEPVIGVSGLGDDSPTKEFQFDGVTAFFVSGALHNLECVNKAFPTHDGVRVGDSTIRLKKIYGAAETWDREGESFSRYNVRGSDSYLVFVARNGKITRIILFLDYT